jgi:hypothetical protein
MTALSIRHADLASMDLDAIVHRIADLNAALGLLAHRPFHPETIERRERLAGERDELRGELDRRAAILWAKLAAENTAAAA